MGNVFRVDGAGLGEFLGEGDSSEWLRQIKIDMTAVVWWV